jgi:hypothetical protein
LISTLRSTLRPMPPAWCLYIKSVGHGVERSSGIARSDDHRKAALRQGPVAMLSAVSFLAAFVVHA